MSDQSDNDTLRTVETPIVTQEAYDYEWLANKTEHEVTTVG